MGASLPSSLQASSPHSRAGILLPLLLGALFASPADAQSPEWNASLLASPFPSPWVSEWERNPQTLALTLNYMGSSSRDFRVEGDLRHDRQGLIARGVSPPLTVEPGPTTRMLNVNDIFDWTLTADREAAERIVRAGVLPEGEYEACARLVDPAGIDMAEACTFFTIALPDAPELLFPDRAQIVSPIQPTFQWTPVTVPPSLGVSYRVTVAERLPRQTPEIALEANVPHFDRIVGMTPLLVYPLDGLDLIPGKEYVWRVEALDGSGERVLPNGLRSEIYTFRVEEEVAGFPADPEEEGLGDAFTLIPGLARIEGLSAVEIQPTPFGTVLNGPTWMELAEPYRTRFRVRLQDLTLSPEGLTPSGGRVVAEVEPGTFEITGADDPLLSRVSLTALEYGPASGLVARGALRLADGSTASLDGEVQVTSSGVFGTLESDGAGVILEAGSDPVRLLIRAVRIRLPNGPSELVGELESFGGAVLCPDLAGTVEPEGEWRASVSCAPDAELPLVGGRETAIGLELGLLTGNLRLGLTDGSLGYDLEGDFVVRVDPSGGSLCRAYVDFGLTDGSGLRLVDSSARCQGDEGAVALDWLRLTLSDLRVSALDYTSGKGVGLGLSLDIQPSLPALPGFELPHLADVGIDGSGLLLPAAELTLDRRIDLLGYGLRIREISLPETVLEWDEWTAGSARAFRFGVEGGLLLASLPGTAPPCLAGSSFEVTSGALEEGRLRLPLDGAASFESGSCTVSLAPELSLDLSSPTGGVEVALGTPASLASPLQVRGSLNLPESFGCEDPSSRRVALSGSVGLLPDGGIAGSLEGFDPPCPFPVAGILLELGEGRLELSVEDGAPSVLLTAGGGARFQAGGPEVSGTGQVELDLIRSRLTGGSMEFVGPLDLSVPMESPVFTFTVDATTLTPSGLTVDGRHSLALGSDATMGVTFDQVTFGWEEGTLSAGQVLFDSDFALEAGIGSGVLSWRAVPSGTDPDAESGLRVVMPPSVALGPSGLRVQGEAGAGLSYRDRVLLELEGSFSSEFVLGLDPVGVQDGVLSLSSEGTELAYVDRTGFHADFGILGSVIPDRLPLPSEAVAYAELRDAQGNLRVSSQETNQGLRIYTEGADVVSLVLPAFRFGRSEAPRLDVGLDLTISNDADGLRIVAGSLNLTLDPRQAGDLGMGRSGIPFAPESLSWSDPGGGYRLSLSGRPVVLGDTVGTTPVTLEVTPGARLSGTFSVPTSGSYDLVDTPGRLAFGFDRLEGRFDADLLEGMGSWSLDLFGNLGLDLDGSGTPLALGATLRASPQGLSFSEIEVGPTEEFRYFAAGPLEVGLADLSVPMLEWDPGLGWDFEIGFDLSLRFPDLGDLVVPPIQDLTLVPSGFTIPELAFGSLPSLELPRLGFLLTPLALRMPAVQVDPFGEGLPALWDLSFDLALALGDLPSGAPSALSDLELTILDASLAGGIFTGTVESRSFQTPPAVPLGGDGMALNLERVEGELFDDGGRQGATLTVEGSWTLPDFMRCTVSPDPTLGLGQARLSLASNGSFAGRVEGLTPACPLTLGPLALNITTADLLLGSTEGEQEVRLDLDGAVRLPGPSQGDTVTAAGSVVVDLLVPAIDSGAIAVSEPFRWDLPRSDPFLAFTVNQGRLDASGLVLTGTGVLELDEGGPEASLGVSFADLTLELPTFAVGAGSVSFDTGFALDATLDQNAISWTARPLTAPRPQGEDGFRMSLPSNVTLDARGLGISGRGSAGLTYADSTFSTLGLDFTDGFAVGWDPVSVTEGRAGFFLDEVEIAYLTPEGFFPGDLFGVLPVPARLPLPSESVAYLQLRDPGTDQVLVESESTSQGLRLHTGGRGPVELVIPGLASGGGAPPTLPVRFDVEVDAQSFAFLSGSVVVAASAQDPPLFDLTGVGLPLEVRRVAYGAGSPGNDFTLDARVALPASMSGLNVEFEGLRVTENGLTGEVTVGSMAGDSGAPLTSATLGALSVAVGGARARFGANPEVSLVGSISADFFTDDQGISPSAALTGAVSASGASFGVDLSGLPGDGLPIRLLRFDPSQVGGAPPVALTVTDSEFTLDLAGVLSVPSLAPGFALSLAGVRLGTGGIDLPSLSLETLNEQQSFDLFGARFTLKNTPRGDPAVDLSYVDSVLRLTMNGELDFLRRRMEFEGLRVSSDGVLDLVGASLVEGGVALVPDVLELTALGIAGGRLEAELGVTLPAPFSGQGSQTVSFSVAPDGSVEGDGTAVLVDETPGLDPASDATEVRGAIATADVTYLGLRLDPGDGSPGSLEVVGDLYLADEVQNRISLGERKNTSVVPGLEIGLDGRVEWGHFSLPQSFTFDFDMLRLELDRVSGGGGTAEFQMDFGGDLSLDLPLLSGSLDFSAFRVTPGLELDTSAGQVGGGNLSIAEVLNVSLSGFEYSSTPTTIETVRTGAVPTSVDQPGPSQESRDIPVESLLRFGGALSMGPGCSGTDDCLLSGGVREFLFYETSEGETSLVVREADFDLPVGLDFGADLIYTQTGGDGSFDLAVGGEGSFGPTGVEVVGVLARGARASDIRAGLFLMVSAEINVVPGVLILSDVGGGFFYRPKPVYCEMVRQYSGVPDLSSRGTSCENVGDFTGFMYAGARVVDESLGHGRVLLTVSDSRFQLDGQMALLTAPGADISSSRVRGTLNLTVGFEEAFAEGNFELTADYQPLLHASSQLQFYVYGSDAWGIYGSAGVEFLRLINGDGEFFVGSEGFFVQGRIDAGFDVWILAVYAEADVSVWYLNDPRDWGAYLRVEAGASILGGAVSASATLKGALVSDVPRPPLVYAGADFRGCVTFVCKTIGISAKFQGGKPSVSLGRDETMERIVSRAVSARDRLVASRDRVQSRIAASRPGAGDVGLTDEELAATYAQMITWDRAELESRVGDLVREERMYRSRYSEPPQDTVYFQWYVDLLLRTGFPTLSGGEAPEALQDTVEARLARIDAMESEVNQALSNLQFEITDLEEAVETPWPESPIRSASIRPPDVTKNGDGTVTVHSQPGVDLDRQAAADGVESLRQKQAREESARQQIVDRIQRLEDGLNQMESSLTGTGPSSLMAFARLHGDVIQAAEEQYARAGDLVLRQEDWYQQELQELSNRRNEIRQILGNKTQALRSLDLSFDPVAILTSRRAFHLSRLSGDAGVYEEIVDRWETFSEAQMDSAALELGMQLWFGLGFQGMTAVRQNADTEFTRIWGASNRRLEPLRTMHSQLSDEIDLIFEEKAGLTGALYDMYDRFYFWLGGSDAERREVQEAQVAGLESGLTSGGSGPSFDSSSGTLVGSQATDAEPDFSVRGVRARQAALEERLQVPTVVREKVRTWNLGYMAKGLYDWSGSHPTGIYEYRYGSFSNGSWGKRFRYYLTPGRETTSVTRAVEMGVRGGAGYAGRKRVQYETEFESSAGGGGSEGPTDYETWSAVPDASPPSGTLVSIHGITEKDGPYWTGATRFLDGLRWEARDPETGIAEFEYALGWGRDTTAVRAWTTAGGRQTVRLSGLDLRVGGPGSSGSETGGDTQTTSTSSLSTTSGEDLLFDSGSSLAWDPSAVAPGYRVYVRARNGEGLLGPPGASAAIKVDLTAPEWVAGAALSPAVDLSALADWGGSFSNGDSFTFPSWSSETSTTLTEFEELNNGALPSCGSFPLATGWELSEAAPSLTLRLPEATDIGSGVDHYAWRVGIDSTATYGNGAAWDTVSYNATEFTVEGPPLDFISDFYVHVVAVDGVGRATEPLVYGPFTPGDPTPPEPPSFCVTRGNDPTSLKIRVETPGGDAEVGQVSYRYRVRTEDGSPIIRDWPSQPDWEVLSAGDVEVLTGLNLEPDVAYWVDVQIENRSGKTATASSGGLVALAPPPLPGIEGVSPITTWWGEFLRLVYLTPSHGLAQSATHRWVIRDFSARRIAEGNFVGDVGGRTSVNLPLPSSLVSGRSYFLYLAVESSMGLSSGFTRTSFTVP